METFREEHYEVEGDIVPYGWFTVEKFSSQVEAEGWVKERKEKGIQLRIIRSTTIREVVE